jgi:Flp pilus assembly protein TadG
MVRHLRIFGYIAPSRDHAQRRAARGPAFWTRLVHSTEAGTAIEFAIIAPALFALILATIQLVLVFLAQAALETACEGSARYVLTGEAQTNFIGTYDSHGNLVTTPQQQFNNYVCSQLQSFMGCGYLFADVQSGASYSTVSLAEPTWTFDSHGNVTNTFTYSPGVQGNIVVVRLYYFWPVISLLGFNITSVTDTNNNNTMYDVLIATSVAKTEGY